MLNLEESSYATVIIDNGTESLKIGFAGDEAPRKVIPTLIGYSRCPQLEVALDETDYYVGYEAFKKRGLLDMKKPIQKRKIVDFDSMEKIWHHCLFNELKVDPSQYSLLFTESCEFTDEDRRKSAQIVFEYLNVPQFYMGNQGTLGLFGNGNTKGVVVDSGEGGTYVIPIFEGYVSPYSLNKTDISGNDITQYLHQLLQMKGITFSRHFDYDIIKDIKETKCYISLDFENELKTFKENANTKDLLYELPDKQKINLNKEQIQAPEILFNPSLMGKDCIGLGELIYKSYFMIDSEIKKKLFDKIFLIGGNTLFPNLAERICKNIIQIGGNSINFKVLCPTERQYSSWIGGSILSCLTPFETMWVSKKEYEEYGDNIINMKRFQLIQFELINEVPVIRIFILKYNSNLSLYYENGSLYIKDLDNDEMIYQQEYNKEIKNLFLYTFNDTWKIILVSQTNIQILDQDNIYFNNDYKDKILKCLQLDEYVYYQTEQIVGILDINKIIDQQFQVGTLQNDILKGNYFLTKNFIIKKQKNSLEIYDRQTLNELKKIKFKNTIENFACFQNFQDQLLIAVSYKTGYIEYFINALANSQKNFYHWHFHSVKALQFSKDGKKIYSGGYERVFVSYDIENYNLDFLPRFSNTINQIDVTEDCQFISIQLENFETRIINSQNFSTIFKLKNIKLENIMNNIVFQTSNFTINKLNNQEFLLCQNFQNQTIDIKILNPTQRNYVITPAHHQNKNYEVDQIIFDENKNFGLSYEYLKEDQEIIFSKLRFFVNDLETQKILNMGEYQDPHIFNKILQIKSFHNKQKNTTYFLTLCQQFIKFWSISYDQKDKQCKFKCIKTLENFNNFHKIFLFENQNQFYIFSQLEQYSQIYELSKDFNLEFIGQFNTTHVKNYSNIDQYLILQDKNHILFLNKQNFLIEHNIYFSDKFSLLNIDNNQSCLIFKNLVLILDQNKIIGQYQNNDKILRVIAEDNKLFIILKNKIVQIGEHGQPIEEKINWREQIQQQISNVQVQQKQITEKKELKINIFYDQDSQGLMETSLYTDKIFDQILLKSR